MISQPSLTQIQLVRCKKIRLKDFACTYAAFLCLGMASAVCSIAMAFAATGRHHIRAFFRIAAFPCSQLSSTVGATAAGAKSILPSFLLSSLDRYNSCSIVRISSVKPVVKSRRDREEEDGYSM